MTDAADLTDHWPLRGDPARLTAAAALLRASDAEQIFGTRFPGEFVLAGVARLLEAVAHDLHRHVDLGEAVVSAASEVAEHVLAYVPRSGAQPWEERRMHDDQVDAHLKSMNDLDFVGWNNADWNGVFARQHTDDVFVDFKGQAPTRGIRQHIEAMQAYVESVGGSAPSRRPPHRVRGRRMDLRRRRVRRRRPHGDGGQVARWSDLGGVHLGLAQVS